MTPERWSSGDDPPYRAPLAEAEDARTGCLVFAVLIVAGAIVGSVVGDATSDPSDLFADLAGPAGALAGAAIGAAVGIAISLLTLTWRLVRRLR